jgi:hypothetical protein
VTYSGNAALHCAVALGLSTKSGLHYPAIELAPWATNLTCATEATVLVNPIVAGVATFSCTVAAIVVVTATTRGHGMGLVEEEKSNRAAV